jgi:hypothetical protein
MPRMTRFRWRDRLFEKDHHLTVFGASVFMSKDAAPRTQAKMQRHVDSCKKCIVTVRGLKGAINVAKVAFRWGLKRKPNHG